MNWAAERIAKEVEDNERLEAKAGTRDFVPDFVPPRRRRQQYTQEERLSIIKRVDELREQGKSLRSAVKELDIHDTMYYQWKRKLK
jgi:hypothetical protein